MVDIIPKGYKKTDVGVIPEDWEVKNLGNTSTLKARIGWQGLTTKEYLISGDYYLITGTDFVDSHIKWQTCFYVNKERYVQDKNIKVMNRDVLVTKDGTIGKIAYIDNMVKPATLNSGVFVIRPKNEDYIPKYFYYVLISRYFDDFLKQLTAGSTINHLYQKDFVGYNFVCPPLPEQTAIVKALSDIDNLISSLEKLIHKKKNIKQGAMQELLTGKKRLGGFSGEWEKKTINDITVSISSGITGKRGETGEYVVFGSTGVIAYTNSYDYEGESILVARVGANAGRTNLVNGKYGVSDNTLIINLVDGQNKLFWYYKLINYGLNKLIFGSGQPLITGGQLKSLVFSYPMEEEQAAIAKILSDMDIEIEKLNEKLNKYKEIKQGMMQELLTGKRRLIHND